MLFTVVSTTYPVWDSICAAWSWVASFLFRVRNCLCDFGNRHVAIADWLLVAHFSCAACLGLQHSLKWWLMDHHVRLCHTTVFLSSRLTANLLHYMLLVQLGQIPQLLLVIQVGWQTTWVWFMLFSLFQADHPRKQFLGREGRLVCAGWLTSLVTLDSASSWVSKE